jgi:hypothetical protein
MLKGDGHHEVEFRLRHKNGTYRWIFSLFVQTGTDGNHAEFLAAISTRTARKQRSERARLLAGVQTFPGS